MKIRFVLAEKAKGAESVFTVGVERGKSGAGRGAGLGGHAHCVARGGERTWEPRAPETSTPWRTHHRRAAASLGPPRPRWTRTLLSHSSSELSSSGDSDAIVAVRSRPLALHRPGGRISSSSEDDGEVEVDLVRFRTRHCTLRKMRLAKLVGRRRRARCRPRTRTRSRTSCRSGSS